MRLTKTFIFTATPDDASPLTSLSDEAIHFPESLPSQVPPMSGFRIFLYE